MHLPEEVQVFERCQPQIETRNLGEYPDAGTHRGGIGLWIESSNSRRPASWTEESSQHPDGRSLASAVRTEQPVDLAAPDTEAQAAHRSSARKLLYQLIGDD